MYHRKPSFKRKFKKYIKAGRLICFVRFPRPMRTWMCNPIHSWRESFTLCAHLEPFHQLFKSAV